MIDAETYLRFIAPLILVALVTSAVGLMKVFGYFDFEPSKPKDAPKP